MYIGHNYAQVGVLFLLSKGLIYLITNLRQTYKDQRLKVEKSGLKEIGHVIEGRNAGLKRKRKRQKKIESVSLISESGFGFTDIGG